MQEVYKIECRTGCTCCANENHYRGWYVSKEAAERRARVFAGMPLLASQYSKTGVYRVQPVAVKRLLDDGTILIEDGVWFEKAQLFDVDSNGALVYSETGELVGDPLEKEWIEDW